MIDFILEESKYDWKEADIIIRRIKKNQRPYLIIFHNHTLLALNVLLYRIFGNMYSYF